MLETAAKGEQSSYDKALREFGRAVASGRAAPALQALQATGIDRHRATDAVGVAAAFMFFTRVVDAGGIRISSLDRLQLDQRVERALKTINGDSHETVDNNNNNDNNNDNNNNSTTTTDDDTLIDNTKSTTPNKPWLIPSAVTIGLLAIVVYYWIVRK
jgi:hypothetical protein